MYKPLSVRKNFSWTFVGNILYAACQWGMLTVLAKLGSAKLIGIYSLAVAIVDPLTLLGKIGLTAVFTTDIKNEYSFQEYLSLRTMTTILTLLVIVLVTSLFYRGGEIFIITVIVAVSYGILSIREMYLAVMLKAERMDWMATSKMIQGVISLSIFLVMILLFNSLQLGVLGLLIARCCVFVVYDIPQARKLGVHIKLRWKHFSVFDELMRFKALLKLVRISFPVGIASVLISLNMAVPRFFLKHNYDEAYLGYFAAMSALLVFGSMIVHALGEAAFPRLAKYYISNRRAYSVLLAKTVGVGAMIGICGLAISILLGRFFLTLFFTAEYAAYSKEFNWIMVAGAITFVVSFFGYGLTAARYFKVQVAIWIVILAITSLACWLLIPTYGIVGAAWAIAIAMLCGMFLILLVTILVVLKANSSPTVTPIAPTK